MKKSETYKFVRTRYPVGYKMTPMDPKQKKRYRRSQQITDTPLVLVPPIEMEGSRLSTKLKPFPGGQEQGIESSQHVCESLPRRFELKKTSPYRCSYTSIETWEITHIRRDPPGPLVICLTILIVLITLVSLWMIF